MGEDALEKYYAALITASQTVASRALAETNDFSKAQSTVLDLHGWYKALSDRPESLVLLHAIQEFQMGLYALALGLYRHAFYSLRLALEISFLTSHFSCNR